MYKDLLIISAIMLVLDYFYLKAISPLFNKMFIEIQGESIKINYLAAAMCYSLLVFALYYFIVKDKKPLLDAFLLGVVIYGIYDTTNMATIKDWQWNAVAVDTIWGGILMTTTYFLTKKLNIN